MDPFRRISQFILHYKNNLRDNLKGQKSRKMRTHLIGAIVLAGVSILGFQNFTSVSTVVTLCGPHIVCPSPRISKPLSERVNTVDFTGTGISDILWYNNVSGQVSAWTGIQNVAVAGVTGLLAPSSGWVIEGTGDFNGDKRSDILWYNTQTGNISIWHSGFSEPQTTNVISPTSGWVISGVGDFNGDGKSDILWYNNQSGAISIWSAGQPVQLGGSAKMPSSLGWVVSGVGDFNGDGESDILWYNNQSGAISIWSGGQPLELAGSTIIPPSSGWVISGVGDFNGDGKSDIVLYNNGSGAIAIWYGGQPLQLGGTTTVAPSSGWFIAGVGDFNGDGKSDILWYNNKTGQLEVWYSGIAAPPLTPKVLPSSNLVIENSGQVTPRFSRNWNQVTPQILAAPNASSAITLGQQFGLNLVVLNGGTIQNIEYSAALTDPVTGSAAVTVSYTPEIVLVGPFPGLGPTSGAPQGGPSLSSSSYVCSYKGANLEVKPSFYNFLGTLHIDSVLNGSSGIIPVYVQSASSTDDPSGILQAGVTGGTADLTSQTGLGFTLSSGSPRAFANHTITVDCKNHDANAGAVTSVISNGFTTVAHISMNCASYKNASQEAVQEILEHEFFHAFGFAHDAGNDSMNYAFNPVVCVGTDCKSSFVMPQNAKQAIQAQLGNTANNLNISNCVTFSVYHAAQCKLNSGFEYCCPGSPWSQGLSPLRCFLYYAPPPSPSPSPVQSFPPGTGGCTSNSDCGSCSTCDLASGICSSVPTCTGSDTLNYSTCQCESGVGTPVCPGVSCPNGEYPDSTNNCQCTPSGGGGGNSSSSESDSSAASGDDYDNSTSWSPKVLEIDLLHDGGLQQIMG